MRRAALLRRLEGVAVIRVERRQSLISVPSRLLARDAAPIAVAGAWP